MEKKQRNGGRSKCFLCKSSEKDELKYGEYMRKGNLGVHYYCLLLTSNLTQAGADDEGFLGFLPRDIRAEEKRCSTQTCTYCHEKNANIACCAPKCRKTFHTVCGVENDCLNTFSGTFQSFCHQHVPGEKKKRPAEAVECTICYDAVGKYNPVNTILAPCCRNGWFHRWCLANFAVTAGYFFKCPLCNNSDLFRAKLPARGIFIPDKDAEWELEENAYAELLERPDTCTAKVCKNRRGRQYDTSKDQFVFCNTCGSQAIHRKCLPGRRKSFKCDDCASLSEEGPTEVAEGVEVDESDSEVDESAFVDIFGEAESPVPGKQSEQRPSNPLDWDRVENNKGLYSDMDLEARKRFKRNLRRVHDVLMGNSDVSESEDDDLHEQVEEKNTKRDETNNLTASNPLRDPLSASGNESEHDIPPLRGRVDKIDVNITKVGGNSKNPLSASENEAEEEGKNKSPVTPRQVLPHTSPGSSVIRPPKHKSRIGVVKARRNSKNPLSSSENESDDEVRGTNNSLVLASSPGSSIIRPPKHKSRIEAVKARRDAKNPLSSSGEECDKDVAPVAMLNLVPTVPVNSVTSSITSLKRTTRTESVKTSRNPLSLSENESETDQTVQKTANNQPTAVLVVEKAIETQKTAPLLLKEVPIDSESVCLKRKRRRSSENALDSSACGQGSKSPVTPTTAVQNVAETPSPSSIIRPPKRKKWFVNSWDSDFDEDEDKEKEVTPKVATEAKPTLIDAEVAIDAISDNSTESDEATTATTASLSIVPLSVSELKVYNELSRSSFVTEVLHDFDKPTTPSPNYSRASSVSVASSYKPCSSENELVVTKSERRKVYQSVKARNDGRCKRRGAVEEDSGSEGEMVPPVKRRWRTFFRSDEEQEDEEKPATSSGSGQSLLEVKRMVTIIEIPDTPKAPPPKPQTPSSRPQPQQSLLKPRNLGQIIANNKPPHSQSKPIAPIIQTKPPAPEPPAPAPAEDISPLKLFFSQFKADDNPSPIKKKRTVVRVISKKDIPNQSRIESFFKRI